MKFILLHDILDVTENDIFKNLNFVSVDGTDNWIFGYIGSGQVGFPPVPPCAVLGATLPPPGHTWDKTHRV